MNNTLEALNNVLFEQIERIMDDDLTEDQFQKEIHRSAAVTKTAEAIIRNGELALKTMQHLNEYGYNQSNGRATVPAMLAAKNT